MHALPLPSQKNVSVDTVPNRLLILAMTLATICMNDQTLISELKTLGFTSFIHLGKSKRDGLARWTWTHPLENEKEWFCARIVEEKDNLKIDLLSNPLGKVFHKNDISGLINYIKSEILKK